MRSGKVLPSEVVLANSSGQWQQTYQQIHEVDFRLLVGDFFPRQLYNNMNKVLKL